MENLLDTIFSAQFAFSVIRVTTPILFAALAALITNKAGVINIGIEGIMLISSLSGVIVSAYTQSVILGLLGAIISGVAVSLVMAVFALKLKSDLVLTGLAINMFASGFTVYLLYVVCNDKATSTVLKSLVVPQAEIPFIKDIPILGEILSGHNMLTYLAFFSVFLIWIVVYKMPIGMRIRSVGENPDAAKSVGVNIIKVQFTAIIISGVLAALGGAYMSMGYMSWFSRDMIAGRGFIGLAAQNLGGATPSGTLFAALVFGLADALSNILQTLSVPAEFIQMIPYLTTIFGLIIYSVHQTNKKKKLMGLKK